MDEEKFALIVFGFCFLASILFGVVVNVADLINIIGVFLLFGLIVFIAFSDKILKEYAQN